MPLVVERETTRPNGNSISYSQAHHDCDLALHWHRERIKRSGLSIVVIYGSALHRAIEVHSKGHARNDKEAVRAAVAYLDKEINSPYRSRMPLTWDDPPETTKDGSISKAKGNYGRLWCREVAVYWLERQVPAWIRNYGKLQINRSEHQIFVPMTPATNWSDTWSFEAKIDLECDGDLIADLKTSAEPWDSDRRYQMQAHLYMAAYYAHYGREPHFKFLVMPRIHGSDRIQEWELPFDPEASQRYLDGVVRRKIDLIEAGIFAANPGSNSCNAKWCSWHHHCIFGAGASIY